MENEKRLIDANALMDEFRRYMVERCDRGKCVSEESCKTCEKSCLWRKKVSAAPTVDAVEVVHGHWDLFFDGKELQCSVCKATFWDEEQNGGTNYCPNCGAKMDGGNN